MRILVRPMRGPVGNNLIMMRFDLFSPNEFRTMKEYLKTGKFIAVGLNPEDTKAFIDRLRGALSELEQSRAKKEVRT